MYKEIKPEDYLFLDLEWANPKNKSICQVGIVGFRDFESWDEAIDISGYIDPRDNYSCQCRMVSGISDKATYGAMDFGEFWDENEELIMSKTIIGHNVRSADLDAIAKNLARYGRYGFSVRYIDTYEMARNLKKDLARDYGNIGKYSLTHLTEVMDLPSYEAHDARADAVQSARLFWRLVTDYDLDPDDYTWVYTDEGYIPYSWELYLDDKRMVKEAARLKGLFTSVLAEGIDNIAAWNANSVDEIIRSLQLYPEDHVLGKIIMELSSLTLAEIESNLPSYISRLGGLLSESRDHLNELLGLLEGIVADSRVSEREIAALYSWMDDQGIDKDAQPYCEVIKAMDRYREDGDADGFCADLTRIVNPLEKTECNCAGTVDGKHFCLSGTFDAGPKPVVEAMITDAGGIIDKTIKKSTTDFLVLGNQGDPNWVGTNYGTKGQAAIKFGKKIISENDLMTMLDM